VLEDSKANMHELKSWNNLTDLMDSLSARGVKNARVNLGIVRGLDYYSGVVFEAFDPSVGIGALVGGGRYDRLTGALGRNDIGATGAAGGVERITFALQKHGILRSKPRPLVYVAYTSSTVYRNTLELVSKLRENQIIADYDMQGKALRKQLDEASTKHALVTIIVAPDEIKKGLVTMRTMKDGTEVKQDLDGIVKKLNETIFTLF
jgi:histidyl-tRNA synthetase